MKKILFALIILACGFSNPGPHPLHVSIMQMDHNVEGEKLEITLKTFVDDFELGLKNSTNKKVFLNEMLNTDSSHIIIQKYIRKMISYKINEEPVKLNWIGWEIDKDEVFIFYEIDLPKKIKSIEVKNEILMEEYTDQANIVHLKFKGENKSFLLEGIETNKSFILE